LKGLLQTRKNMTIIDEAGIFASSTEALTTKVKQIKILAYTIRKLNSSMLIIAQSKGSVVPALREELVEHEFRIEIVRIHDKIYRNLIISDNIRDGYKSDFIERDKILNIPLSNLPFDSKFIPKLEFDIDIKEFYNRIGEYDSLNVRKHALSILNEMIEES